MQKSVWPLRETINALRVNGNNSFPQNHPLFLGEIYGNTLQVMESIQTLREMVSTLFDLYLSSTNNKMNEVMKVLTVIGTIFLPLTFITGMYGMNFRNMPELESPLGYPIVLGIIVLTVLGLLFFFKRKKWL